MVVDLPAPFGPSSPNTSPGATSKSMPCTAGTTPALVRYVFVRPRTSIAAVVGSVTVCTRTSIVVP